MSRRVKYIILISCLVIILGYFSKPDRGGVQRCVSLFSLSELNHLHLEHSPMYTWELFETPKFQFKIGEEDFKMLSDIIAKDGYSAWTHGSLSVGSLYLGGSMEDDFIYCSKKTSTWNYYWSYSANEKTIYAVTTRS